MVRENFSSRAKKILGTRVGYHCSNPHCKCTTVGPAEKPDGTLNLGVAAHITAASPRGPRYRATLSEGERKSIQNGIWLCQRCSVLIDRDSSAYSIKLLLEWKSDAEAWARHSLEGRITPVVPTGKFEMGQFQSYCQAYASLESLRIAADNLWENRTAVNTETLTIFAAQQRGAKEEVRQRAIFFEEEHFRNLMKAFDFFDNFRVGKGHLGELLKADKEAQRTFDSAVVCEQIRENWKWKIRYDALVEKTSVEFRQHLRRG